MHAVRRAGWRATRVVRRRRPRDSLRAAPAPQGGIRPEAGGQPTVSEFDRLRGLLLGEERSRLDSLQQRLDDPGERTRDVADVLPEAVRVRAAEDQRLIDALQEPLEACLRRSVQRDPRSIVDALFPVMGPAIRRAITETLKGFVQSINQAVEHSLSIKGLRWRIEAMRSGSSFAEVVLKHTLLYRVDAAYLIHPDTGLLIDHALAQTQTTLKDEDAMSAMLTAIEDFVQESFSQDGETLETVEIGDRSLWVFRGPVAVLACVISGIPPQSLRSQLEGVLHDIHKAFGPALRDFDGDKEALAAVHPLLEQCLALEYREADPATRSVNWWPWAIGALFLLSALGWFWWQGYQWDRRLQTARAALEAEPGVVLLDWRSGRRPSARLLVDPLAADPAGLIRDHEVAERLSISRRPYISADERIVLARSRQQLKPPDTVMLMHDQGVLRISGVAPRDWIARLRASAILPPGVESMDLDALMPDDSDLARRVRDAIEPPGSVAWRLNGADLVLAGSAPYRWIDGLPARLAKVGGLGGCDSSALKIAEAEEARALAETLADVEVRFDEGVQPLPDAVSALDRAAAAILRLGELSEAAALDLRIAAVGHSDGIGSPQSNHWLRRQRAEFVIRQLRERRVPMSLVQAEAATDFRSSMTARPELRRVNLHVDLGIPPSPNCGN